MRNVILIFCVLAKESSIFCSYPRAVAAVHTLKKGQKAAHPRSILIFKVAEFANFIKQKQFRDFDKIIAQIFQSIIHTQVIKVRTQ